MSSQDVLKSLPEFQSWKNRSERYGLLDFLACVATPDLFFAVHELLVPKLVLCDEVYFIHDRFDQATYDLWRARTNDKLSIQRTMNHIHLLSIFQQGESSPDVMSAVASLVANSWTRVFFDKGLVGETLGTSEDPQITLSARK